MTQKRKYTNLSNLTPEEFQEYKRLQARERTRKKRLDPEYKAKQNVTAKRYADRNREKVNAGSEKWRLDNLDRKNFTDNLWSEDKRLDYHIVYCLPNCNPPYAGVTCRPYFRMNQHNTTHKRDSSDWFILSIAKTRREALDIEAQYHKQGYGGGQRS